MNVARIYLTCGRAIKRDITKWLKPPLPHPPQLPRIRLALNSGLV